MESKSSSSPVSAKTCSRRSPKIKADDELPLCSCAFNLFIVTTHAGISDDDVGVADGTTDMGAGITDVDGAGAGTDGVDADTGAVAIAGTLGGVGAGVGIVAGLPVTMPVVKNSR